MSAVEIVAHRRDLPEGLDALVAEALDEGEAFVGWLVRDFVGRGRHYAAPGEALFAARADGALAAVAVISADHTQPDARTGRLRFIYVRKAWRRRGIFAALVDACLAHGRRWSRLTLHTESDVAARVYESRGFAPTDALPGSTHLLAQAPWREPPAELRVALIGAGFMGKAHALAWNAAPAALAGRVRPRLSVLCDVGPDAAERAAEWGFARVESDWRNIVADPAIDAVSIATPNDMHRDVAVAALEAGKHVWCEKPMAPRLADAEAMAQAAFASEGVTLLGYNYLRNPAIAHARRLIEAGLLGRVVDVRGQFDEDYFADAAHPWSWRMSRAAAGSGVCADLLCHVLSLTQHLVGPVERLCASASTAHRQRRDGAGALQPVDTDDVVHALVRFADDIPGALSASRVAHGRKNFLRIEIHGERGMLAFDQERMNELELFLAEGEPATRGFRRVLTGPLHPPYGAFCPAPGHQLGFNDLKAIECAHFLAAIAGDEKPFPDFAQGLQIERALDAILRSADGAGWVVL